MLPTGVFFKLIKRDPILLFKFFLGLWMTNAILKPVSDFFTTAFYVVRLSSQTSCTVISCLSSMLKILTNASNSNYATHVLAFLL